MSRYFSNMFIATTLMFISFSANADSTEGQSSLKLDTVDDVKIIKNKVPGEDVDELITNNKLRAESGSKSRWSVQTAFNYDGGSLDKPLAEGRPNIQGVTGSTDVTDLNGNINVKYNMTQKDSWLVGGGLRWITPLQGQQRPTGYNGDKFDIFDPQINYQRIYRIGAVQSYFQVGPTFYTRNNLVKEGYIANFGVYNVNAFDIPDTGWTIGMESQIAAGFYKAPQAVGTMSADDVRDDESDYSFFLYPYIEYKFTERLNFRTVSFLVSYEHTRLHPASTWRHDVVLQSAGLGISVTRDIFLYPNIQFIPDRLRAADTNVGLSANINVF